MSSSDSEQTETSCQHKRVREFLNSDQYHLTDVELISHLDECPRCRECMQSIAGDTEQWNKATKLLQPSEFDQAGNATYSAASVCSTTSNQPTAATDVLDSLTPSEEPSHLGRLGTYEVTGVIGVGGMGVVLKAIDPSLDRVVAVKVMSPRLANNQDARKRFAREAKAAAAVLHPNVIPIHSVSSGTSLPYLVMSYVRGGSLQKRLEQQGQLPLIEVLRIGSQIASGLQAAHEQGLIHRDIKPENILLEEGVERVTITDFGLARSVDDNTITQFGAIAGTPQYMSPEQARGEALDQQSDLFSLGSVLYTLCSGRPPFRDDTSYGVMRRIIDETPPSITKINDEIPSWMEAVIERLMSKEKSDRFASAGEVHDVLETCLSHVQQPTGNPLPEALSPKNLRLKRSSLLASRTMKVVLGGVVASCMLLAGYVGILNQRVRSQAASQSEGQVRRSLSSLSDYIDSMMNSPHDVVFLNLGEIGEDQNYVVFKPIEGGVVMGFPAFDTASWNKRQSKYVRELKKSAESLSLVPVERSTMAADGSVKGITFEFHVAGDPVAVSAKVEQLITQTFRVDESESCTFQYRNLPSSFSVKEGDEPKRVGTAEFLAEARQGKRVYLGEQEAFIYLIDPEKLSGKQVQWDQEIWYTDLRDLSPGDLAAIRKGEVSETNNLTTRSAANEPRNDHERIQGSWQVTYSEDSGRAAPAETLQDLRFVFSGSTLTIVMAGDQSESTFKLDPDSSPKSIDLAEEGRTQLGIYELAGDTLSLSLAEETTERPKTFESTPDKPADLMIKLRRVKQATPPSDVEKSIRVSK